MKTIKSAILLEQLMDSSIKLLDGINRLEEDLAPEQLELNDGAGRWNILQVLDHLNSYSAYYLPLIEMKTANAGKQSSIDFTPGWLGAYFTRMMQPKDGTIKNKMKAFSKHIPPACLQASKVIPDFLQYQRKLIFLLELGKSRDMNNIRIPISLSSLIRLKLGDTFNFIIAHNNRHWLQIENILAFNNIPLPVETVPAI